MGPVADPPPVSCPLLACHLSPCVANHTGTGRLGGEKPSPRPAGRLILTVSRAAIPWHGDELKQAPGSCWLHANPSALPGGVKTCS